MRLFIIIFLTSFTISASARACDLANLFFGAGTKQIVDQYNLDVLGMDTKGEFIVSEGGKIVCDGLPEKSIMEFTFIDNVFVKLHINSPNESEELLQYAKKAFGENDDKDRKKAADGKTTVALWANPKISVLYSNSKRVHKGSYENLDISSMGHKELFSKIAEQKGKAINEYLKASGKGKYSSTYQGAGGSSSSGSNTNGAYDPNALKGLKNKYDAEHDAWKKKNDANNKGR